MTKYATHFALIFFVNCISINAMHLKDGLSWYEQQPEKSDQEVTLASGVHDYFNLDKPNMGQVIMQQSAPTHQLPRNASHDRLMLMDERAISAREYGQSIHPSTPSLIAVGGSSLSRSKADLPFYE